MQLNFYIIIIYFIFVSGPGTPGIMVHEPE
jgi:hypothetical protein